jgi:hypothetical protein
MPDAEPAPHHPTYLGRFSTRQIRTFPGMAL